MAACDLLASLNAVIVECACMVELKALGGYQKLQSKHPSTQVETLCSERCSPAHRPSCTPYHNGQVWSLISEELLTLQGSTG